MTRFEGKVAVVTGAAGGIGRAIAERLASEGARVAIADLRAEAAAQTATAIPGARGYGCDVSDEAAVDATAARIVADLGRLDVVVNNAGMMPFKPLPDFAGADWLHVIGVDLMGAVHFTRALFRHATDGGAVVNVASVHAVETTPQVAPYAAAKAAMLSLTRSTAIEGAARGIRANAVLPGAIDTPMLWDNPNVKSGVEMIDRSAVGKPEDVAAAVAFLAAPEARFVTGAALAVDGGRLARL
ncbi:SDR family NAD(P)-dependent oxidoreductase [Roseomonas sp. CCTCC AB2023176]|uniref:SDR family NAD(P)-dependent oxidoreductase n=1 Tax=Roseomonas sp. CCTCC AB2023176 TaxID=3342640 RepID=UPI0035D78D42